MRLRICGFLAAGACLGLLWAGQDPGAAPALNARDMFYAAADTMDAAKPPAAKQPAARQPVPKQPAAKGPTPAAGNRPPAQPPAPPRATPAPQDAEAHFQRVSQQPNLPLGLRYSILKRTGSGLIEVKPDSEFHSGDRIRLSVMGNQKGYLYVIARGSSGTWTPLFPHPESSQQQNEIVPGRNYQVPGGEGEYFLFDQQAGAEKIFLLLSKAPVKDLDALIVSLNPQSPPPRPDRTAPVLAAGNRLDDRLVDGLRNQVLPRDLVFTRTDAEPAAANESSEKAVYVVNQNSAGRADSRVVVDLTLRHQ